MTPVVSIIIPTYNHASFLREALESVCSQTFENWEVIVVNNFSKDDTITVVESFLDARIRLENFHNHGVIAASRNHGIKLSNGELLAFLDSDDLWSPDKLAKCIDHLKVGGDLICHALTTFGDESDAVIFGGPKANASFKKLLYQGCCLTTSATVVRKRTVIKAGGFSEDSKFTTAEDYHLWIKLAQMATEMKFSREILGQYRIHAGNQSGSVNRHLRSTLEVIEDFIPAVLERSLLDKLRIRRRQGIAYYGAGRAMQKAGCYKESSNLFFCSIAKWPFYSRVYMALLLFITSKLKGLYNAI